MEERKKACYICTGCDIGEKLDIEALSKLATDDFGYPVKTHQALCSKEGAALIKADIEAGTNAVSIAACSPRAMYDVFDFEGTLIDRINLREQVVWCTEPDEPAEGEESDLQMLAEDYFRIGLTKLDKMEPPEPWQAEDLSKKILVVGGGKSGMSAALSSAQAGYEVVLVEREAELGGFMRQMNKTTPLTPPYRDLEEVGLEELVKAVQAEEKIEVFTKATVEKIEGGPGVFDVTIAMKRASENRRCGAIVQATGWDPYDPKKLPQELGYGQYPNVMTNAEFEEMAWLGQIKRPSDGGPVKTAVFIQCAGSRDPDHLPYCSAVCCQVSMKQAAYLKEQDPESVIYIVYRDVRTPGQFEEFYRKTQEDGAVFIRAQNRVVGDGFVEADDELLGEKVRIEDVDLVVLATGMVPTSAAEVEEAAIEAEAEAEAEAVSEEDAELAAAVTDSYGAPILNLAYRQGGELPLLRHGFPDSNFICFPYESRRSGIYACGPVRRPMGLAASAEDAAGAAMKAIQAVEAAAVGQAPHPRAWDFSFPEFAMERCTQCKRCTEECPFGAINEDEKANPLPELTRCRRCGICMGACPERIISFKNYSVDMVGSMIKSIEVPEEEEEKPRAIVFVCENDAYPALDMAAFRGRKWSPYVRFIPLRCLGSLNLVWIADALASGLDGILLLGCRHGDDYQCHFVRGSLLAETRMSKIKETLERLVLESERIRVEELSIVDYERVPRIIEEFMETIEEVGPNPYKGF